MALVFAPRSVLSPPCVFPEAKASVIAVVGTRAFLLTPAFYTTKLAQEWSMVLGGRGWKGAPRARKNHNGQRLLM